MPSLTPLPESSARTLSALAEAVAVIKPALYSSARTFASTRTFPSAGTPRTVPILTGLSESSRTLTPLAEA